MNLRFFKDKFIEYIITSGKVSFAKHCHSSVYVITLVISGIAKIGSIAANGCISSDGCMTRDISSGELFTVNPYESHSLTSDTPVCLVTMCIDKKLTGLEKREFSEIISGSLSGFSKHISGENFPENMRDIFYSKALEIYGDSSRPESPDKDPLLFRCIHEIEKYPEKENDIGYFAGRAFISKYHFIRKFREYAGLTPHKFHILRRVRLAQRLLEQGRTIADTSLISGFCDQSHLCRSFKNIVGISPGEYREQTRNFLQD